MEKVPRLSEEQLVAKGGSRHDNGTAVDLNRVIRYRKAGDSNVFPLPRAEGRGRKRPTHDPANYGLFRLPGSAIRYAFGFDLLAQKD